MSIIRKATSSDVGPDLTFVLSDATVDRMGDTIDPAGWDLRWFKKNPIALFGHDNGFPIGNWADVRVEAGKLKGRLSLASEGTSPRIDEVRRLVEQGVLRAVSVGFKPIEAEPKDKAQPWGPQTYRKSELLECSLVSVPANPAALAVAKAMNISDDTIRMAFGEHAKGAGDGRGTAGEHADPNHHRRERGLPPLPKGKAMTKTISQRVEDAQAAYVAAKDAYVEYGAADDFEPDHLDGLEATMKQAETQLGALKRLETNIMAKAEDARPAAPAVSLKGRQKDVESFDLLVRAMTVHGASHFGKKPIDQVLDERYKGHEATAIVTKADQTIGTTTVSGWASELVQTVYGAFMEALIPTSFFAQLRNRGVSLTFDGYGKAIYAGRTAGGASGGFVAEGAPIRVGRATTTSMEISPRKMGVIVPFSRELAKRSTPVIEAEVRRWILEDTSATLDQLAIDAVASSTARPAGLLNGVSATASGAGGGDYEAVKADFKALLAPFISANAADGIVVLMNPSQGLSLGLMDGPPMMGDWFKPIADRVSIIESGNVPANRLIALRASDFVTAGDSPEFDISEQATVHMEDTNPLEIVSGTGPTTADPVRSFYQTATIGVRMLMDVSWAMRRSGMVRWIDTTSW